MGAAELSALLRAAGEETRLRVLALLAIGELSVGELAHALHQSQPRISRHLRLLYESGLVTRRPEGAWVFYRLVDRPAAARPVLEAVLAALSEAAAPMAQDAARLTELRSQRAADALVYFAANAEAWEQVQARHLPNADIDAAILAAAGPGPFAHMIDVGVGQGRMLALFADRAETMEGFDLSRPMLAMARAALQHLGPARLQLKLGDINNPPVQPNTADLVTVHHVLHFLPDPGRAVKETARLLKPGGRLLIADFAPHQLEFLREAHAHRRLGFSDQEMAIWLAAAGLELCDIRTLAPSGHEGEALTVKIWTADACGELEGR